MNQSKVLPTHNILPLTQYKLLPSIWIKKNPFHLIASNNEKKPAQDSVTHYLLLQRYFSGKGGKKRKANGKCRTLTIGGSNRQMIK